jgi:hypothetical protein
VLSVTPSPPSTFECLNQSLWNLVCVSWHLSPSQRLTSYTPAISLCVCLCIPPVVATQRLGKHVLAAANRGYNRRIVGSVIFCAVRVLWKESLWICVSVVSLLGNNLIKTFSRGIAGGVIFYAVVSYQRKVGDQFFPELLVLFLSFSHCRLYFVTFLVCFITRVSMVILILSVVSSLLLLWLVQFSVNQFCATL